MHKNSKLPFSRQLLKNKRQLDYSKSNFMDRLSETHFEDYYYDEDLYQSNNSTNTVALNKCANLHKLCERT